MAKARALYICPVGEAAIVAAAPVIAAGRDYDVVSAVLPEGLEDRDNPTDNEKAYVVRPGRGIARFLLQRNIDTTFTTMSPFDVAGWRDRIVEVLAPERLAGIDIIIFNALAGTRQMSFGAWEGLVRPHARGANLAIRKCFVTSNTATRVQFDRGESAVVESEIEPLPLLRYLELYGFQEWGTRDAVQTEAWLWQHRDQVRQLWRARIRGDDEAAGRLEHRLAERAAGFGQLADSAFWHLSYWLDAGFYVALRDRKQGSAVTAELTSSMKILDWAQRGKQPLSWRAGVGEDHEIDAAVLTGGVLHLFECKNTGKGITQEMIAKQVTLRKRLQGRAGVNAIVSRVLPGRDSALRFKAADGNVQLLHPGRAGLKECLDRVFGPNPR